MRTNRTLSKTSRRESNNLSRRARATSPRVREAARSCIDILEGRLLLSTTTISYPTGFANAFDINLNGSGATVTSGGEIRLLDGTTGGQADTAYNITQQAVSTFDTTFKFDFGTQNPDADGFTFILQNDPTGPSKIGGGADFMGYGGTQNSVAVKFDLWDNTAAVAPSYTASGVYTNGEHTADDPRQSVSTTAAPLHTSIDFSKNADGSSTGLDFHANKTDQFQVHLVYDGTTLTETLTDLTLSKSATQTYAINIPAFVGSNMAYVGFGAGDGGAFSTPQIASWVYTGNTSAAAIALPAPVLSGSSALSGSVNLNWTETTTLPVTGYEVDQVSGTTATPVATLGGTVTNYQVNGLNPSQSYTYEVKALGDGTNSANSPFSNSVTVSAAGLAPNLTAYAALPGQIVVHWNTAYTPPNGLELDASTDNGATFSKLANFAPANGQYTFTGLDVTKTYQLKLKAVGNGTTTNDSPSSNVVTVSGAGTTPGTVNIPNFQTNTPITLNGAGSGGATLTGPNGTPPNALELTHNNPAGGEGASAFYPFTTGVDTFDTTFQWTYGTQHAPVADGFTFTIQGNSPTSIGGTGGALGYGGMPNSVAVIFNLYNGVSQTGLATNGNIPATRVDLTKNPDNSATGIDFHAHPGDTFQAHLTYDGTTLTETVTDQTQGPTATFSTTYAVDIPTTVGAHAAFAGFTGATGGAFSQQDILNWTYTGTGPAAVTPTPIAVANSSAPGVVDVGWTDAITAGGFEVDQSTDGTNFTPVATNLPATSKFFEVTGLAAGTYFFRVKSTAVGDAPAQTSNVVQITVPTVPSAPIDYSGGFNFTGLQFNGTGGQQSTATITGTNQLQLTAAGNEGNTVFATTPQNINGFDTTFDFTYVPGTATPGDGFSFIIQNSPDGAGAIGQPGGGLGYGPDTNANGNNGGIPNSIAVKFDLYSNNGEGTNSTGLFSNGDAPTAPVRTDTGDTSIDLTASGVHLATTDTYHAHLSYDGTTLHEVLTDVTTGSTFSHDYAINLSQIIKGNTAYIGFGAGTGGALIEQDINNWKFTHVSVSSQTINGTSGNDTITIRKDATDATKDDIWVNVATTGAPTLTVSNGQTIVVNGGGGTDTLTLDSTNGNPIPTGTNAVLRLNSGTGSFTIGGSLPTLDAAHVVDVGTSTVNIPYTGTSILPAVQSALRNGFIKSTDAAGSSGKFNVSDTDTGTQITLKYLVIGDLNGDGSVNFNDLLALAQHYGNTGADWAKGDLNYDGTVNFNDLLALAQHYGQTAAVAAAPASTVAAAASPLVAQTDSTVLKKRAKVQLTR